MPKRKRSQSEEMENYTNNISTALTLESLRTGRLTQSQMDQNVLFKNYNPGEPSCRLYVKNVAKQASQEELEQIFRIFVNSKSSDDLLAFDVRLMTTGRMKGQAFVSLKSIETAEIARQETNGFQLHGKPIVVCFARSNQLKQ